MRFKNNPLFWLIVGGLATWRLTSILHEEEIAAPVRKAIGIVEYSDESPSYWTYPDTFIGKMFQCFWCLSVWVGGAITLLLHIFPRLSLPFALSSLAIGINYLMHSNDWIESTVEWDDD